MISFLGGTAGALGSSLRGRGGALLVLHSSTGDISSLGGRGGGPSVKDKSMVFDCNMVT